MYYMDYRRKKIMTPRTPNYKPIPLIRCTRCTNLASWIITFNTPGLSDDYKHQPHCHSCMNVIEMAKLDNGSHRFPHTKKPLFYYRKIDGNFVKYLA